MQQTLLSMQKTKEKTTKRDAQNSPSTPLPPLGTGLYSDEHTPYKQTDPEVCIVVRIVRAVCKVF